MEDRAVKSLNERGSYWLWNSLVTRTHYTSHTQMAHTWFFNTGNLFNIRVWCSISFTTNTGFRFSVQNGSTTALLLLLMFDSFRFNPSPFNTRTTNYTVIPWECKRYIAILFCNVFCWSVENNQILTRQAILPHCIHSSKQILHFVPYHWCRRIAS